MVLIFYLNFILSNFSMAICYYYRFSIHLIISFIKYIVHTNLILNQFRPIGYNYFCIWKILYSDSKDTWSCLFLLLVSHYQHNFSHWLDYWLYYMSFFRSPTTSFFWYIAFFINFFSYTSFFLDFFYYMDPATSFFYI